jgi:hypothetical protein
MGTTLRYERSVRPDVLMDELLALPSLAPDDDGSGQRQMVFRLSVEEAGVAITLDDYLPVTAEEIEAVILAHDPTREPTPSPDELRRRADLTAVRARARAEPEFAALLRLLGLDEPASAPEPPTRESAPGAPGPALRAASVTSPRDRPAILRERLAQAGPMLRATIIDDGYRCDACTGETAGTPSGLALTEVLAEPLPPLAVWQGLILIDAEPERLDGYAAALEAVPEWQRGLVTGVRLGTNPGDYDTATGILTLPRRTATTTRPAEQVLHHLFGHAVGEAAEADLLHQFAARFWVGDIPLDHPDPLGAAGDDLPGARRHDFAESYRRTLAGEDSPRATWMRRRVFKEEVP